jgi:hypothetical protein
MCLNHVIGLFPFLYFSNIFVVPPAWCFKRFFFSELNDVQVLVGCLEKCASLMGSWTSCRNRLNKGPNQPHGPESVVKTSSCSSDEGVRFILLKQEVPCHAHRSLYCILTQINPIYSTIMIHLNIILTSALMSPKFSTPFRFPDRNV